MRGMKTDIELIAAAKRGDPEAFAELWQRHRPKLYYFAIRKMRNPHDAEDCVQRTAVKLLRKLHQFRGDSAFSSWLMCILINEIRMDIRKRKRAIDHEVYGEPFEVCTQTVADPICQFQACEALKLLRLICGSIKDEPVRQAFQLAQLEGVPPRDGAVIAKTTIGGFKGRLFRGREQARKAAERFTGEPVKRAVGW